MTLVELIVAIGVGYIAGWAYYRWDKRRKQPQNQPGGPTWQCDACGEPLFSEAQAVQHAKNKHKAPGGDAARSIVTHID